jgi:hypothetical protein
MSSATQPDITIEELWGRHLRRMVRIRRFEHLRRLGRLEIVPRAVMEMWLKRDDRRYRAEVEGEAEPGGMV